MTTNDLQQRLRNFIETYRGIDDLGYTGLMYQAADALDKLERIAEAQRHEAARARAQVDNAVALLTGIHALLYPAPITTPDGRTMVFRPKDPDPHQVLQELSDRIRALPEKLAQYPKAGDEQERKDAERLDWLEGQKCVALTLLRISAKPDATRYWCIEDWDGDDVTDGVEPEDRQTLRAAIDAAMLAKEPAIPSPAAAHRTE